MNQSSVHKNADVRWDLLFVAGGMAALLSALIIPIQIVVFLLWPPPLQGGAAEWFALYQKSPIIGLINLDLLLVLDNVLLIAVLLALYIVLRGANPSLILLALGGGMVGVAMYIASNPAVEMLALSRRYVLAADASDQAILLAAGEALIAGWQGTAFHAAYWLGSLAGIAIGIVMLQSGVFGKTAATMGVLANAVGLGLYVPVVGVYISVFSVLFLEIWYILVGLRLVQLAQSRVANEV